MELAQAISQFNDYLDELSEEDSSKINHLKEIWNTANAAVSEQGYGPGHDTDFDVKEGGKESIQSEIESILRVFHQKKHDPECLGWSSFLSMLENRSNSCEYRWGVNKRGIEIYKTNSDHYILVKKCTDSYYKHSPNMKLPEDDDHSHAKQKVENDLEQRNWSSSAAQITFRVDLTSVKHYDPTFLATYSTGGSSRSLRAALKCIRCGRITQLDQCSNCGSLGYVPGLDTLGIAGIFCFQCQRGFTTWNCQYCSTDNPIENSIMAEIKKGCFIATAAYGAEDCIDVQVLRSFRDQVLLRSMLGTAFVQVYYHISPPIARMVESSDILRIVLRSLFLRPICQLIRAACASRQSSW